MTGGGRSSGTIASSVRRLGFDGALAAILGIAFLLRLAYVLAQPGSDPAFSTPMLDGAIYVDWARALVAGEPGPAGAYYQAPLYPWALAAWFGLLGERFGALYLLQQVMMLAAGFGIARIARNVAGAAAGLWAASLFLLYAPTTFFASRPLGEPLGFLLLVASLALVTRTGTATSLMSGVVAGLAALARPNLLLVPLAWAAGALFAPKRARALWVVLGVSLVVLPVAVRNHRVSGHWVPISSNAGLTSYHGNGPGATGIFTQPAGFSGSTVEQREEATRMARRLSGLELDDVEADRWWGRAALRERLDDPLGSVALALKRVALLIDTHEHGLDYSPTLDANPFRLTLRFPRGSELGLVPLALLLGLSGAAVVSSGLKGSAGRDVWLTILACAAMPLMFYVSSRYRFPAIALLSIPAGVGAAALTGAVPGLTPRRRNVALLVAGALAFVSLSIPSGPLRARQRAMGLSNLAVVHERNGDLDAALTVAREAVAIQPDAAPARLNLAMILERAGRPADAEREYLAAIAANPALARAAGNLGGLLIGQGRPADAAVVLRRALATRPDSAVCWNNLVVALVQLGDVSGAERAIGTATDGGVPLDPELVSTVRELARSASPES